MLKYKDEFLGLNKFIRNIDNKKFYFENNKEILFMKKMKTKFISKLSAIKNLKNKFITLDIETFNKENILIPYLIRFYDGINCYSY
jgi:c-di-GMP-binding flagellar brake protein YcgR